MELDKDTQKVIGDGEKIQELVNSPGWELAKEKLWNKIVAFSNVMNVKEKTPEEVFQEVAVRKLIVDALIDWIKEVEGSADQAKSNAELLQEHQVNSFIKRYNP